MYYVYLTTDNKHDVKYVGQHKTNHTEIDDMLNDRYFGKGTRIKELIKQYGKSIFSKEILEICKDKEEAEFWELFYIDQYDAIESEDFYNIWRTASEHFTDQANAEMSELKKEYYKNNPGKHSKDMKAYYSNPRNRKRCKEALALRFGYDNYAHLLSEKERNKKIRAEKYRAYKHIRHVNAQINHANRSKNRTLLGDLSLRERASKQWEIPEIRKKMIKGMKGPRLKSRGMRGINNTGELSYIDQYFYDLKEHPRKMGKWADAFIIYYRHRKYKSVENAIKAITRQCNRINECGYSIDIQEALKWYLC